MSGKGEKEVKYTTVASIIVFMPNPFSFLPINSKPDKVSDHLVGMLAFTRKMTSPRPVLDLLILRGEGEPGTLFSHANYISANFRNPPPSSSSLGYLSWASFPGLPRPDHPSALACKVTKCHTG